MSKEQPINLNISDFLKVFAVASVILQTVLSYVLTHSPQTEAMNSIGSFTECLNIRHPCLFLQLFTTWC